MVGQEQLGLRLRLSQSLGQDGQNSLGGRGGGVGERVGDGVPTSCVPVRAVLVRQPALRRVESMAGEAHATAAYDPLEVHPEPKNINIS